MIGALWTAAVPATAVTADHTRHPCDDRTHPPAG